MNPLCTAVLIHFLPCVAICSGFALSVYSLHVVRFDESNSEQSDHGTSDFYRDQYRKVGRPKLGDIQYSLTDGGNNILATLRLCKDNDHEWVLLRSVCVAKPHRRKGLALELLHLALEDFHSSGHYKNPVYCFAEPDLSELYRKAGFQKSQMNLPTDVLHRFEKLKRRVSSNGNGLECFQWAPLNLILLQHQNELTRKTGTGKLLFGTRHLNVMNLSWGGRVDNELIQDCLQQQRDKVVLLWTGGDSNITNYHDSSSTYLLLDGTWQEAQNMFRKIPELQGLARMSLQASSPSNYTLRQNFGWKDRFALHDGDTLLCTVEIVAELIDQIGNQHGARLLRNRLAQFQCSQ